MKQKLLDLLLYMVTDRILISELFRFDIITGIITSSKHSVSLASPSPKPGLILIPIPVQLFGLVFRSISLLLYFCTCLKSS